MQNFEEVAQRIYEGATGERLLGIEGKLQSSLVLSDRMMRNLETTAINYSKVPSSSLEQIVLPLVHICVENGSFLVDEILELFEEKDFVNLIAQNFVRGLSQHGSEFIDFKNPRYLRAKEHLMNIIQGGKGRENGRTENHSELLEGNLSKTLEEKFPVYHRGVPVWQLFYREPDGGLTHRVRTFGLDFKTHKNEVYDLLVQKINKEIPQIIRNGVKAIFGAEVKGEKDKDFDPNMNKRWFILNYIFRRVLIPEQNGKVLIDDQAIAKLVKFLEEEKFLNDEEIWQMFYREVKAMHGRFELVFHTSDEVRAQLREQIPEAGIAEEFEPLDQFSSNLRKDFDKIFGHFKKKIRDLRDKKLPKNGHAQLVDLQDNSPDALLRIISPEKAVEVLQNYAQIIESADRPVDYLRMIFNLSDSPIFTREDGSKQKLEDLSDEEVQTLLGNELASTEKVIHSMFHDAFKFLDSHDEIREKCRYLPEIMGCRDPLKLFTWLAHPERFKAEFPQYKHLRNGVIKFEISTFLFMFLKWRELMNKEPYKSLQKNRKVLEDYMASHYEMENIKYFDLDFRVLQEVDEHGQAILDEKNRPLYQAVWGDHDLIRDAGSELTRLDGEKIKVFPQPSSQMIEKDGKHFKAFPIETKKMMTATLKVPVVSNEPEWLALPVAERFVKLDMIFYVGSDEHFVKSKGAVSYFLSNLRNNGMSSDLLRFACSIQPHGNSQDDTPNGERKLRYFVNYNLFAYFNRPVVIKDQQQNRHVSSKTAKSKNSGSAEGFNEKRDYVISLSVNMLENVQGDATSITFEGQGYENFGNFLCYFLSNNTASSHEIYEQKRVQGLVRQFLPGVVFGSEMVDLLDTAFEKQEK
jgi:hypothetical protein